MLRYFTKSSEEIPEMDVDAAQGIGRCLHQARKIPSDDLSMRNLNCWKCDIHG
jgi:hypothetical protein